jgi:uracil phosphoribosyltransferase
MTGSKIGGDKDNSIIIIPDPMGATGSTVKHVYDYYEKEIKGEAQTYIGLQLIVTPEYVQRILKECPKMHLFCLRLDRGLSTSEILKTEIGKYPEKEKGLNSHSYIVPGAGGIGELMNNSFC